MKVIVDANIVFSGILNTKGKIGDLLINSTGLIDFIAPDFLRTEIRRHHKRLVELSKLSLEQVSEAKIGGVIFYDYEDIQRMIEDRKQNPHFISRTPRQSFDRF